MFISNGDKSKRQDADNIKMESFYAPCINALGKENYNIFAGINADIKDIKDCDGIHYYNQNIYRSIFAFKDNWKAYKNINTIIKKHKIDVIHCNTPIGGLLGRICGHKNKVKTIIYTVHGFHFFKGNNMVKNLIFKTIEKHLARYTDAIITMNQEDYENAKKFKLRSGGRVFFIHGIGIKTEEYQRPTNAKKRKELGLSDDDIVIISAGDLVKNKNYELAINIIKACNNSRIKYLICGKGPEQKELEHTIAKLGLQKQVKLLGFRTDMKELYSVSDIFLFTTKREGLPRSLMEAMASGLPCVVSKIRGNTDLLSNDNAEYCCENIEEYTSSINRIINNPAKANKARKVNAKMIKNYDTIRVIKEMKKIYSAIFNEYSDGERA